MSADRMAVIFPRLGPYHIARLSAAARHFKITAIELSATDELHAWQPHEGSLPFERKTLFDSTSSRSMETQVDAVVTALEASNPAAVAVNGWSEPTALAALEWCLVRRIPAILMSESSAHDMSRVWWKELVKRRIVSRFSAALVGGADHARYLQALGMSAERISLGYDAVDNEHFANASACARTEADLLRAELNLSPKYFVASARCVPRKNLETLIRAFRRVQTELDSDWQLRILGDGPEKQRLMQLRDDLQLNRLVHFDGFIQYEQMPVFYGLASAFVHPSTSEQWGLVVNEAMACGLPVLVSNRCGCVPELVSHGRNGFTFCPEDEQGLAELMIKCVNDEQRLSQFGAASREIITSWGPERFAAGLQSAYGHSMEAPRRLTRLDKMFLRNVRCRRLETSWFSTVSA